MTMNEIQKYTVRAIDEVISRQAKPVVSWEESPLAKLTRVEIDTRGTVGELLVVNLLKTGGRKPDYNENKTDSEKHWDFMCDDLTYEVKTASLGKGGDTFQHENIFKTRLYDGLIFVDIAPNNIYISMWVKADIKWNKLHTRKDGAYYKWDTSLTSITTINRGGKRRQFCVRENLVSTVKEFLSRFEEFEEKIKAKKRNTKVL